ncbi:MAG TPA: inositol monophosphatase family protein [Solirubrobacteraceae bacterium]|jgi:myo-inositol-1(or 4)-monophosphatase
MSDDLLDVAVDAARAAGTILLEHYERGVREVTTKSTPTDLVSEADLEAERAIREILTERRPGDAILGEEGDDIAGTTGLRWVVDPLDGTVNYLFAIPQWAVSVACEGQVGVIFDPLRDELFSVRAGEEAELDGTPLRGSRRDDLGTAMVSTGFGYDARVRAAQAEVVARLLPQVRDIRRLGSAALDLAWLAAGRYDAYYEYGLNAWDWAAGEMLCTAAGLEVRHLGALPGTGAGLLVAAPGIVDAMEAIVSPGA